MKYYYCSAIDGKRFCLLAGPFVVHEIAIDMLPLAKQAALNSPEPRFAFAAFGTCSFERDQGEGKFNNIVFNPTPQ